MAKTPQWRVDMMEKNEETLVYDAFSAPHPAVEWLLSMVEKGVDVGPMPLGPSRICKNRREMEREVLVNAGLGGGIQ